ncbi:metal-sensitive transcriptional regulator, partial [Roseivivax halotolerans]|uniref:metal-sensitive transcriptional regulator n=1 Tax=Roseivivax halotolerans TaxID=93684 RepID=UPI003CCC2D10
MVEPPDPCEGLFEFQPYLNVYPTGVSSSGRLVQPSIKDMDMKQDKQRTLDRLSRLEGQVRGVARMVESDRYCMDILAQ